LTRSGYAQLASTFLLVRTTLRSPRLYRQQVAALLVAVVIPWISNAIYIFGLSPVPGLELTPLAFTLTGLIISWAIFHFRMFELLPVARDALVESMDEGVLVDGIKGTLLDYALAGDKMIVLASPFLGVKFENILKGENPLGAMLYIYSVQGR
jgi:hypothetical protein